MKETYRGSCHCGAVTYRAAFDLQNDTSRCNCSLCSKFRLWKVPVAGPDFELLRGASELSEYRFNTRKVQHQFCKHCGTKLFGRLEQEGKQVVVLNVATLDGVPDEVLAAAHLTFMDGRHDAFDRTPDVTSHL